MVSSSQAASPGFPGPGERFGDYVVEALIGEGASGKVYRAVDLARRPVALKVHKASLSSERMTRFEREGRVAASLRHPGILSVHGAGLERGLAYLVYELVEDARELDEFQRGRPLAERVATVAEVAEALAHAHANGVVHRDLKSANVIVDGAGRARVADFGLAKEHDAEELTRTGQLLGTPVSMAPEQVLGDRSRIGPHTDVWALGVLLYEALCERSPFEGSSSFVELQARILREQPPPPTAVGQGVSADLESICAKALAKSPGDRYATADGMAEDLWAALAGRRPSTSASGVRWGPPRTPTRWGLAGAAALAVVGLAVTAALVLQPPEEQAEIAPPSDPDAVQADPPSPEIDETPSYDRAQAAEELRELRDLRGHQRRMAATRRWLKRYPGHPSAERLAKGLARDERRFPIRKLHHEPGKAQVYGFFLDAETIATVGGDGVYARWNLNGKQLERRELFERIPGFFDAGRVGPFVVVKPEQNPLLWIAAKRPPLRVGLGDGRLCGSPDGRLLASVCEDRKVRVYAASDRGLVHAIAFERGEATTLAFSRDSRQLAIGIGDRGLDLPDGSEELRVYRVSDWSLTFRVKLPAIATSAVFSSPSTVLLGMGIGRITEWDLEGDRPPRQVSAPQAQEGVSVGFRELAHQGQVRSLALHPSEPIFYSLGFASADGRNDLCAWNAGTYKPLGPHIGRPHKVLNMELAPDGRHLVVGTRVGLAELWVAPR